MFSSLFCLTVLLIMLLLILERHEGERERERERERETKHTAEPIYSKIIEFLPLNTKHSLSTEP